MGKREREREKKREHQAYFANKINIYMKTRSVVARIANERDKKRVWFFLEKEIQLKIQAHTHTDLRDEKQERERQRETGITVIRTVSSAYVE